MKLNYRENIGCHICEHVHRTDIQDEESKYHCQKDITSKRYNHSEERAVEPWGICDEFRLSHIKAGKE